MPDTNSVFKYAALSEIVYSRANNDHKLDINKIAGITKLESDTAFTAFPSTTSGFHAEAFVVDSKTVIAFRGTDFADGIKDHVSGNAPLAVGDLEAQQ